MFWQTARRKISLDKTLVMAILNVTPDSFSDGGEFFSIDDALRQAEILIDEGADIIDVGGESTRPNSERVSADEEIRRVVSVIEAISNRFDVPISVDTSKAQVAESAIKAGAEIINDVSGLRFDKNVAEVAAKYKTGLVLMYCAVNLKLCTNKKNVKNILQEVAEGFKWSIEKAESYNIKKENIVLDVGIGFSKTFEQNLELIGKLDKLCNEFPDFPMLVGTSRKSFIGKILDHAPTSKRLNGTLAADVIGVWNGAKIVRVHDVKAAVESIKIVEAIKNQL